MTPEPFDNSPFRGLPHSSPVFGGLFLACLLALGAGGGAAAQERSPVLKDRSPERSPFYLRTDRSTEILFDAFMLARKAGGGDPVAQHELGLRYLQGIDFAPDTSQAAEWISRAAGQGYVPAVYNLGILEHNGWGREWDPFGAYRLFRRAAEAGLPEGMYMTGLLHTDNLAVRRDYRVAWKWISAAADSGHAGAVSALEEFRRGGILALIGKDSAQDSLQGRTGRGAPARGSSAGWSPVFIDFGADSLLETDDETLAAEAFLVGDSSMTVAAEAGAPEPMTWLGRRSEIGAGVDADPIAAAAWYLRAVRNESRRAPILLWRLATGRGLYGELAAAADGGDLTASYVWAALWARGFDAGLGKEQALARLRLAADGRIPDALFELASWHESGELAPRDDRAADSLLALAAKSGSREAGIRRAMAVLRGADDGSARPADLPAGFADTLIAAERDGSLLAVALIGRCRETGIGFPRDIALAVAQYRKAAGRGSRFAYDALKSLYDERRPEETEFEVDDR